MPTKNIILKKLKQLDTIWHPETGLVFKSRTEKVVTGTFIDDQFVELDDNAIELCEMWGFKIDETLLAPQEEVQSQEEEEEEEEDVKSQEGGEDVKSQEEKEYMAQEELTRIENDDDLTSIVPDPLMIGTQLEGVKKTLDGMFNQLKHDNNALENDLRQWRKQVKELKSNLQASLDREDVLKTKFDNLKELLG